jgi:hypothetical protein
MCRISVVRPREKAGQLATVYIRPSQLKGKGGRWNEDGRKVEYSNCKHGRVILEQKNEESHGNLDRPSFLLKRKRQALNPHTQEQ